MVNMLIYRSPAVLPAGDLQINMLNITTYIYIYIYIYVIAFVYIITVYDNIIF